MPDKKQINRTFASELRTLPVELVPPDPAGLQPARKSRPGEDRSLPQPVTDGSRSLVDRLIDRIKKI
jgi:hypothetical protein